MLVHVSTREARLDSTLYKSFCFLGFLIIMGAACNKQTSIIAYQFPKIVFENLPNEM